MLNKEQALKIKQQIYKQIEAWQVDEQQKQEAKEQIEDMNEEKLEEFLIKNNLIKKEQEPQKQDSSSCPFCLIAQGKIPSYKLDETKTSVAVLEINPLSKGHSIVIPKEHKDIDHIPSQAFTQAKKIAKNIRLKLKPKEISIQSGEILGHSSINIIPVYGEPLSRTKASEQDLASLQQLLKIEPKPKRIKEKKTAEKTPEVKQVKPKKELPKAPRRIP